MRSITVCPIPADTLLDGYRRGGAYTDCYTTSLAAPVTLAQYIAAFYTTPLFRLERVILRFAIARPSTDAQAQQLAEGAIDAFAAWRVEGRSANELLLCDVFGRTRSWLMAAPEGAAHTRLYFGSAVVPVPHRRTGQPTMGAGFVAGLGFHRVYSRLLLSSARARLASRT